MYHEGKVFPKDGTTAIKWSTKAADQGDANAQSYLGDIYAKGKGVPKNVKSAVKWFTLAAEQGDADSQYNLGQMYREGKVLPESDKTPLTWFARSWYTKAAMGGVESSLLSQLIRAFCYKFLN